MKVRYTTIISSLLFLIFLGFAGLENYLILFAFIIVLFVGISKKDLNNSVILLFIILLLHVFIYYFNYSRISMDWLAKNLLNPVILCFLGFWLTSRSISSITPIAPLIYGLFLHGALNILLYVISPSTMIERSMVNIWGGQLTATLQNLLFIPIVSLLFYGVYVLDIRKGKILIVLACLIAVYGSIVTASRTLLFLVIICFLINMIFGVKKNPYKIINILTSIFILVVLLFIAYKLNLFGIRLWVDSSNLGERISTGISTNDSLRKNVRWTMSLKTLVELPSHPFGKITAVQYAHNLFLDMAKYTGIIPALGLLGWSFSETAKQFFYTLSCRCDEWDIILLSMSIGFILAFFLEPILEGLPIIFSAFCYLCGVMKGRRKRFFED